MWPFKRRDPIEKRAAMSGFTAELMAARESYISGTRGIAELTGTAQSCITLWESGLGLADVTGTDLLTRRALGLAARALALRGEAVFLIREDGLVPCSDWDLRTRNGRPTAYRVGISEAGGGRTETALAAEVLHFRIGSDVSAPYHGQAPLKRAQITAGLLNAVETALSEVFDMAPLGSQVVPYPESPDVDSEKLGRSFAAKRGKIMLRESVTVAAAGGPAPVQDWKPQDLSPDLSRSMTRETLTAARESVCMVYGVLPGLINGATTGPMVREAQRHLAQWMLQPIATCMAEEVTEKLGTPVSLDVIRPLQAFDAGGRARAFATMVAAVAQAKEAGIDPQKVEDALKFIDWAEQ